MKRFWILLLLMGLAACKPAEEARDTIKDGTMTTLKQPDRARALQDLTNATAALQTYYLTNGKYPASLDELKLQLYNPGDLSYDPKTGKVHSKAYPQL